MRWIREDKLQMPNEETRGNLIYITWIYMLLSLWLLVWQAIYIQKIEKKIDNIEKTVSDISATQTDLDFRIDETQELILQSIASVTGKSQLSQKEWVNLYGIGTITEPIEGE